MNNITIVIEIGGHKRFLIYNKIRINLNICRAQTDPKLKSDL